MSDDDDDEAIIIIHDGSIPGAWQTTTREQFASNKQSSSDMCVACDGEASL